MNNTNFSASTRMLGWFLLPVLVAAAVAVPLVAASALQPATSTSIAPAVLSDESETATVTATLTGTQSLTPSVTATITFTVTSTVTATASVTGTAESKVAICHRTGSEHNPYNLITVSVSALPAHRAHGDIVPAPPGGCPSQVGATPSGTVTATTATVTATTTATALVTAIGTAAVTGSPTTTTTPAASPTAHTVTICHATGSTHNPYVLITISVSGLNGHSKHARDIIPAPAGGCPAVAPAARPSSSGGSSTKPNGNGNSHASGNNGNGNGNGNGNANKPAQAGGGKGNGNSGNNKQNQSNGGGNGNKGGKSGK